MYPHSPCPLLSSAGQGGIGGTDGVNRTGGTSGTDGLNGTDGLDGTGGTVLGSGGSAERVVSRPRHAASLPPSSQSDSGTAVCLGWW